MTEQNILLISVFFKTGLMTVMCGKEACGLREGAAIKSRSIFPSSSSSSLRAVPFSTVSRSGPRPSFSVSPLGSHRGKGKTKEKESLGKEGRWLFSIPNRGGGRAEGFFGCAYNRTDHEKAQKSGEEKLPRNKAEPRARGFTTIF